MYALDWLRLDNEQQSSVKAWLDGQFGDPFDIGRGKLRLGPNDAWDGHVEAKDVMERIAASMRKKAEAFAAVLQDARALIRTEHFHNTQSAPALSSVVRAGASWGHR